MPENESIVVGKCPKCGKNVIQKGKVYRCESIKSKKNDEGEWEQVAGCGFMRYQRFLNKQISPEMMEKLLDGEKVYLEGVHGATNPDKIFDCYITVGEEDKFNIDSFVNKKKKKE